MRAFLPNVRVRRGLMVLRRIISRTMGVTNLVSALSSEQDDSWESETVAFGKEEALRAFFFPRAVVVIVLLLLGDGLFLEVLLLVFVEVVLVASRFLVVVRRDTAILRGTPPEREPLLVLGVTQ